MTNENARKGTYFEELFCHEIKNDPQNIKEIVGAFSKFVPESEKIQLVEREGQYGKKSDVFISTTGGHNFRASIKSFQGPGFNQVTRMTIENFVTLFDLSNEFREVLEKSTIKKARDSRTKWISSEDSNFIICQLNHNKPSRS